jgi:heme/copper-type cytochrome/quinol oxidase subunit 2
MTASLAGLMFWLSVASCVVAEVAIISATLRVSRTPAADTQAVLPHPVRWLEIVWLVLPAIALAALLLYTGQAIFAPDADAHVLSPVADALPSSR